MSTPDELKSQQFQEVCERIARMHAEACEQWTEQEVSRFVGEILKSGDFTILRGPGNSVALRYEPFHEADRLRGMLREKEEELAELRAHRDRLIAAASDLADVVPELCHHLNSCGEGPTAAEIMQWDRVKVVQDAIANTQDEISTGEPTP